MRRRYRTHGDGSAEIDITPMLDVVFILLIFFRGDRHLRKGSRN